MGATSLSQIIEDSNSEDNSLCISFISEEGKPCMTKDGISNLWVKIDDQQRITKVLFYGKSIDENSLVITRNGFCGIKLEYDEIGNETKRTYLGKDGNPTNTLFCYSIVSRTYDSYNRPIKTLYFDIDGKTPCKHSEGNIGFKSYYDEKGNEIIRTFIGNENDELCQIQIGICGQKAKYNNDNNQMEFVVNIDKELNPCQDFYGFTAVHIEYDDQHRDYKETFCDSQYNTIKCKFGYSISINKYDAYNRIIATSYFDDKLQKVKRVEGYHEVMIDYDNKGFPEYVYFKGLLGEPIIPNGGTAIIKRKFNDIGQIIEEQYLGPDGTPMYNTSRNSIIKLGYEGCIRSSYEFLNHQGLKFSSIDQWSTVLIEWDRQKRHIIKHELYDEGKLINRITQTWLDDYTYTQCFNSTLRRKFHTDAAGRDIYEEWLDNYEGWHHKTISYDIYNRKSKEIYFNEDGTPWYDDKGDCGLEFIYNEFGVMEGVASLGAGGLRHINNDGYCVRIIENNEGRKKVYYFDIDEVIPRINTRYGFHKSDNGMAFYDENGKLCNTVFGYAKITETDKGSYFFDKDENPVCAYGFHRKVETRKKNKVYEMYYDK